ncbi:MAG TPA: hypothetical protein VM933_11465 [Acidimicrobiales bacterium]|nr:hypothetical protein [Acidimicrobiales bacterium]
MGRIDVARAVRDLVPVTLVAGAAALAVTFVVGGTTSKLATPSAIGPSPFVTTAGPPTDVEVTSRPAAERRPTVSLAVDDRAVAASAGFAVPDLTARVLDLGIDRALAVPVTPMLLSPPVPGVAMVPEPAPSVVPTEPAAAAPLVPVAPDAIAAVAPVVPTLSVATAPSSGKGKGRGTGGDRQLASAAPVRTKAVARDGGSSGTTTAAATATAAVTADSRADDPPPASAVAPRDRDDDPGKGRGDEASAPRRSSGQRHR